jgi:ATP-dependent Clp protease ATP-binding subunit ClpX
MASNVFNFNSQDNWDAVNRYSPKKVVEHLNKIVIGQSEAKEAVAKSFYNHYLGLAHLDNELKRGVKVTRAYKPFGSQNVLFIGGTGVGKTLIVENISNYFNKPFSIHDAAQFVANGIVGANTENMFTSEWQKYKDISKIERSTVFIDEIDKLANSSADESVYGNSVQKSLLRVVEGNDLSFSEDGSSVAAKKTVYTGQMLFVSAGAFSLGLTDIIRKRKNKGKSSVGFINSASGRIRKVEEQYELLLQVIPEDLVEYGLMAEFVARWTSFVALHPLSSQQLKQILTDVSDSTIGKQKQLFALHNIELLFTEGALTQIANQAYQQGTGARGLENRVRYYLKNLDPVEMSQNNIAQVIISEKFISNSHSKPKFTYRNKPNTKQVTKAERLLAAEAKQKMAQAEGFFFTESGSLADDLFNVYSLDQALNNLKMQGYSDTEITSGLISQFAGISRTASWVTTEVERRLGEIKQRVDFQETTGSAKKWWIEFENVNLHRVSLVLRLAEELAKRRKTITEFFLAFVYSSTENIQSNIHYMDYVSLKKEAEQRAKNLMLR